MFKPVSPKVNFPALEEKIIQYWKKNNIFEKSLKPKLAKKTWTFLDGPPFITGLPHYGSLLSSIPKDVFPRFKTMQGYQVRRVWGWDCHGLPAENKIEEKLGIKRKKDIEESVGVKKFIDECKDYVGQVSSEWEWYIDRVGRWVDFKNAYKTMDLSYMESVMWVFKKLYEKGFIYKGLRVSLYCPHCATPISNFEVAMDSDNYKEIAEPATTYKYQLKDEKDTYLLAWSTTPWNKLATPALAVNPKLRYVKVLQGNERYILAKSTLEILKGEYKILEEFVGQKLLGQKFIPHYDFYSIEKGKKAFIVIGGDFVTADEGTGIVTIAAYGEEDLAVMKENNIQIVLHVDDEGMLKKEVPHWGGMYYLKVNKLVNKDLAKRGLLYKEDNYIHTVPTCWRCHTRLFYAPQDAWYVDIQKLKPKLKKNNESVNWFPAHFKYGRFLKSMTAAPDWCISRSRYWGSPVPVWECVCGNRIVVGSLFELEKASGTKITDLHKPAIDDVVIKCPQCGKRARRVSEVLDSWIEAGSASFAEHHYPFEKEVQLKDFFPPDFIVEYTGQIRAWFYVLHVIATALYDSHAFKNVVVTGVILGSDGRKMSKNYGNYPDPKEMIQKYGGDALRLYLLGSPVMHGEDILISEADYRNQIRGFLLMYWNIYNFFVTYANLDKWLPPKKVDVNFKPQNLLDQWVLSRLHRSISEITAGYEHFDTPKIVSHARDSIVKDISTWYVRRIRGRVGAAEDAKDKNEAYQTLWTVLVVYTQILAPLTPFITEEIFRNLTGGQSVHLTDWPIYNEKLVNKKLEKEMRIARKIVEQAHKTRKLNKLKVRQPLQLLTYGAQKRLSKSVELLIADEVNVKEVKYELSDSKLEAPMVTLDLRLTKELQVEGQVRELIRNIQILRKEKKCKLDEKVSAILPVSPDTNTQKFIVKYEKYIKKKALIHKITWGDKLTLIGRS